MFNLVILVLSYANSRARFKPVCVRIDDPREHQRSISEEIITIRVDGAFTIR